MQRLNKRHRFIPNHCNSVQWLKWSLMNIPYVCVLTLKYPTTPPEVWICFILNLFAKGTIKTSSCQKRDLIYSCTQPFSYLPNQWTAWMIVCNPLCTPRSQLRPINTDVPNLPIFGILEQSLLGIRMVLMEGVYKVDLTQPDTKWPDLYREMGEEKIEAQKPTTFPRHSRAWNKDHDSAWKDRAVEVDGVGKQGWHIHLQPWEPCLATS